MPEISVVRAATPKPPSGAGFREHRGRYYYRLSSSTLKYLLRTEVHTFAFSVAANAILAFFPFMLLLMNLALRVFHSQAMYDVIKALLRDYVPSGQEFVIRNLNALVWARSRVQVFSLAILLVTSTGVFLPLEVALNRVWRFPTNRSYLGNQTISLLLAFACGILALLSIAFSAGNIVLLRFLTFGHDFFLVRVLAFLTEKVFATLASMAIFFLIYWLLPNGKVPAKTVLPAAVIMGVLAEVLKYSFFWALPRLNFQDVYGPFALSASMMFWAFLLGLLLLTGAHLSAQKTFLEQE